jgi:hypothetical protein
MADQQTQPEPAAAADGAAATERPAWADELKTEILGAVHKLVDPLRTGGTAQTAAEQHEAGKLGQPTRSLDEMIAEAIAVNDKAKADEAAAKSTNDRLTAVEAAAAERPPVERGRMHRFMGWGEQAS